MAVRNEDINESPIFMGETPIAGGITQVWKGLLRVPWEPRVRTLDPG